MDVITVHVSLAKTATASNDPIQTQPKIFQVTFFPHRMCVTQSLVMQVTSGFGGLEVACWPLVPKFAGSHPAEAVGFLGGKNPQHAFLLRESKAVGPM